MDVREANIHQWVEYSRCLLQRCGSEKELAERLKELNCYLSRRTFFAGESCSEADVSVFKSLHAVLMNQGFNDKEMFRNVSRWFDHIQHEISAPDKSQVIFLKSPIYLPALV